MSGREGKNPFKIETIFCFKFIHLHFFVFFIYLTSFISSLPQFHQKSEIQNKILLQMSDQENTVSILIVSMSETQRKRRGGTFHQNATISDFFLVWLKILVSKEQWY